MTGSAMRNVRMFLKPAGENAFKNVILATTFSEKVPESVCNKRQAYNAPDIDAMTDIQTGATELRHAFPAEEVGGIITSYMNGLNVSFAIALAACAVGFLVSLCNGRQTLSKDDVKDTGVVV